MPYDGEGASERAFPYACAVAVERTKPSSEVREQGGRREGGRSLPAKMNLERERGRGAPRYDGDDGGGGGEDDEQNNVGEMDGFVD